jgi:hypothetical protein
MYMLKKLGKGWIAGIIIAVLLLTTLGVILFDTEVGMATDIGIQEPVFTEHDFSSVPQAVIDDATKMAGVLAGKRQEKLQSLKEQLLASYVEAKKVDFVVFFNSGGMGWNLTKDTPGWGSILDGIQTQLKEMGYTPLVLNYRRTSSGIMGCVKEVIEAVTHYPHKAKDLAVRIEFLTDNLPDLKVIIAGESTGTVISEEVMAILKDKDRVYSIQTGTPFWHKPTELERTLLINSNGRGLDTFSKGNIPAMVWATVKSWFGLKSPDENPGNILTWLKAPGHDYSWQYPGVYSAIVKFLDSNFGNKD